MQIKKRFKKEGKEKAQAIFQITNLILSIIAISFIIGIFNIDVVSGKSVPPPVADLPVDTSGLDNIMKEFKEFGDRLGSGGGDSNVVPSGADPGATVTKSPTGIAGDAWKAITGEYPAVGSWGYSATGIVQGALWGMAAYYAVQTLGSMFSDDQTKIDAASVAAGYGVFAGKGAYSLFGEGGMWAKPGFSSGWATVVGLIVAIYIYYSTYEKTSYVDVTFTCYPWEAPVGGKYCEECNKQGDLTCSEYQCRSLGQSCQLLNAGTEEEKCAWINRNDVEYPIIKPLESALLDNYEYKPDNTISPPDRGVIISNKDSTSGCVKAFTPLGFGIELNEPAKCKIDYLRKETFDDMNFYFGGSPLLKYNHTQVMSLPGPSALASENLTIENDGEYELYVRCQDANGNYNTANFVFKYCVEKGPDTTPPLIITTSLLNNMPIAYEQSSVDLEVYINEPSTCKWSHLDQNYDDMEEPMTCSSSIFEMNAQMLYKCSTTLTGLKDRVENKFYFRCKDHAENVNAESYEFTLIGTQPLIIDSVGPNGTIKDSTESVKVTLEAKTSAGYKEGEATCYYSDTGEEGTYIMFFETQSYQHSQNLWLSEGDYEYFIRCIDLGGNSNTKTVNFRVESDSFTPIIVRAYHEETYLKLVTNEKAECVYDTVDCSYLFDDGTSMTVVDETNHFTDWNTNINFYVKCRDEYGNQPYPNECNMIVRPFEIYFE